MKFKVEFFLVEVLLSLIDVLDILDDVEFVEMFYL